MEFGRKICFATRLYNIPATFVGPSRELPESFSEILFIIFRLLALIIFDIFRAKMMKCGRKIFFTTGLYHSPGTLAGTSRDLTDSFYEILLFIFRMLVLFILGIFRAKIIKL